MSFKTFLEFVRIEVKTASVLPLILGIVYCWYVNGQLNPVTTIVHFVANQGTAFNALFFIVQHGGWNLVGLANEHFITINRWRLYFCGRLLHVRASSAIADAGW